MSDDDAVNPFNNPLFAQFRKAMSAQGPLQWDVARQTALMAATDGGATSNVDPQRRIRLEGLAEVVRMRATEVAGWQAGEPPRLEVVNRATWVQHALDDWRPYFDALARAIGGAAAPATGEQDTEDPMASMLANVSRMIAPSMLGMSVGNLVGRMAARSFGQYDLPLPRERRDRMEIVVGNVDAFADEWAIPRDDMAVWAIAHELVGHRLLSGEGLGSSLRRLITDFAGGFRPDPGGLAESLTRIDVSSGDPMRMLDSLLSDPTVLLGASRSAEQHRVGSLLDAGISAVVGYVDHAVDQLAVRLLGDPSRITEAVRRRRVAGSPDRLFVERLLGIDLTVDRVAAGRRFVDGVLERAGEDGLAALRDRPDGLPTPPELEAPGLWLARLETTAGG